MSKEATNIISLINKGILPPINQNETFGINTSMLSSSNKSKIKKQAYKEFAERLKEKLEDCHIISDGEYCGFDCGDVHECLNILLKEMVGEEE